VTGVTLNNVKYFATKTTHLANGLISVSINQSDVKTETIKTSGFVDLPVELHTDFHKPGATISVRLSLTTMDLIYT
jgi:hypothetical protein